MSPDQLPPNPRFSTGTEPHAFRTPENAAIAARMRRDVRDPLVDVMNARLAGPRDGRPIPLLSPSNDNDHQLHLVESFPDGSTVAIDVIGGAIQDPAALDYPLSITRIDPDRVRIVVAASSDGERTGSLVVFNAGNERHPETSGNVRSARGGVIRTTRGQTSPAVVEEMVQTTADIVAKFR